MTGLNQITLKHLYVFYVFRCFSCSALSIFICIDVYVIIRGVNVKIDEGRTMVVNTHFNLFPC